MSDVLTHIDKSEIKKNQSLFGNFLFELDEDDLNALKEGKVLYHLDEYGIFIKMKEDSPDIVPTASGCLQRLKDILDGIRKDFY